MEQHKRDYINNEDNDNKRTIIYNYEKKFIYF